MVDVNIFKKNIKTLISQKYELKFLGGSEKFNKIVKKLSQSKADEIYRWIEGIIKREIRPITTSSKQNYKDWLIRDLLTFRKELKIDYNEYRVLFIKVKNSFYIEFYLGDHRYYDKIRKKLNLTKKNY